MIAVLKFEEISNEYRIIIAHLFMNKRISLTFLLIFSTIIFSVAATVDTVTTYSNAMKKNIKAVVITPDHAGKTALPAVYLLHGAGGGYANWLTRVPELKEYSDDHQMIIVCPDGDKASWYFDSPKVDGSKYETYIAKELISWIDKHYPTIKDRKGRAITGLSMGGHGALYLAFKHQDVFGAAGSMSGGLDLRPFAGSWGISEHLGTYATRPEAWEQNTVINLTHLLTPTSLQLIIDCGIQDFFYNVNTAFHQKLLDRNIPHDFISRPGTHNWEYWRNAVKFQLVFMNNFFETNSKLRN